MDEHGTINLSFIVRIWLEEAAKESGGPGWRGSVTHVPSGEKCYFDAFAHLVEHMERYLEMMGVPSERKAGIAQVPEGAAREEG
jgi:hypothetical protein